MIKKSKIQRKIVTSEQTKDEVTFSVDEKGKKVFRLKNILPSGKVAFTDEKDKVHLIDAGCEFDINEEEIEQLDGFPGFEEGFVIFTKNYLEFEGFINSMSDEKITELTKLSLKKFEKAIDGLDSQYVFKRIQEALIANQRPSGYLQYVTLREDKLQREYAESQKYMTDAERNKELFSRPMSR